jgi:hypothetical protein
MITISIAPPLHPITPCYTPSNPTQSHPIPSNPTPMSAWMDPGIASLDHAELRAASSLVSLHCFESGFESGFDQPSLEDEREPSPGLFEDMSCLSPALDLPVDYYSQMAYSPTAESQADSQPDSLADSLADSQPDSQADSQADSLEDSPTPETNSCIFCSGSIPLLASGASYNKRKRTLTSLGQFVSARCQPTPYAFQHFSGLRGEGRVLLCVSCVNWQRRCAVGGRKKPAGKPLLLVDHVATFMLQPGTVLFPDQRCVLRLLSAMREPGDDWVPQLLLRLMPVPVQTMIGMLPSPPCRPDENLQRVVVEVWWEYNGRTVFFAHHLTAKLIRRHLKETAARDPPRQIPL